jgi:hypothetical protein
MSKETSIQAQLVRYLNAGNNLQFVYTVPKSSNVIVTPILEFEYLIHEEKLILNLKVAEEEVCSIYFHLTNAKIVDVYQDADLEHKNSISLENDTMRLNLTIYKIN